MDTNETYRIWCKKVLFTVQLVVLISMLITAIVNIVLKTGNLPLWTALLGSSLGYLLPTPRFRSGKSSDNGATSSTPSSIVS